MISGHNCFILILLLTLSCTSAEKRYQKATSRLVPEPDIVYRLKYDKMKTDTLVSLNQLITEQWFQLKNVDTLCLPSSYPFKSLAGVKNHFQIYKTENGEVEKVVVYPYPAASIHITSYSYYFDQYQLLYAFEGKTTLTDTINENIIDASFAVYFDQNAHKLDSTYQTSVPTSIIPEFKNRPAIYYSWLQLKSAIPYKATNVTGKRSR